MDLRRLRYFSFVAAELSFTRAARRLNMAQPPLSQQIRELESELGFALFDRGRRAIQLTQAGRDFLPEAERILAQVEQLKERAARQARGEQARLRIGVVSSMTTREFAAFLRAFQEAQESVAFDISDRPTAWQLRAFARGQLDVGFLAPSSETAKLGLASHRVRREALKLAVPHGHRLANREAVEWRDLAGQKLVIVDPKIAPPGYYAEFYARCREAGVEPRVGQYTRNVATQLWMVSAGLGLAPIPFHARKFPDVEFIGLPKNAPVYEIAMVWRRADPSPALRAFIDYGQKRFSNP